MTAQVIQFPKPETTDDALERRIDRAYRNLLASPHPTAQRWHFDTMCALIRQRSRQQIERMERERGLR